MTAVVISGIAPYDGSYPIPSDFGFTMDECYRMKVVSRGIRAGELLDALDANDTAAYVALAVVAVERNGGTANPDDFWRAEVGSITIDLEDDADPPTTPSAQGGPDENESSSGDGSETGGG